MWAPIDAEKYTEHTGAVRVKNVSRRKAYLKNWPYRARQQVCRNAGANLTPRAYRAYGSRAPENNVGRGEV
jgi:hypothetical protein